MAINVVCLKHNFKDVVPARCEECVEGKPARVEAWAEFLGLTNQEEEN